MTPEQFQRVRRLFEAALELRPERRAAYVAEACRDDPDVRREVERLLEHADDAGEPPTAGPTALPTSDATVSAAAPERTTFAERTIGPYHLLRKLGEGGMGVVYEAEQTKPVRRRVAVKLIKHGLDSSAVLARFEAERQALALMNHPNIARVLDAGTDHRGAPYFVMEYIKGEPITAYCDRHKLGTRERIELVIPICEGVQHAHQKGVIHRDLKPSNILVEIQDDRPVPRIIDFGVAKAIDRQLTERTLFTSHGQMIGTPEYMSPEQAEMTNLDIDTRTDVYSLGVVLYELLVGELPFDPKELRAAGFDEMRRKIREETPPKPSTRLTTTKGEATAEVAKRHGVDPATLAKSCRGDLDWITMKALEKDRTRRYPSASGLAEDLRHYLKSEPVSAGPPSVTYRMRKFVRRHRVGVGVAASMLVLVLAGLVGTTYGLVRALRAERQARLEAQTAEQVARFMYEMFEINDPGEARGNTVTAREILDRGVERIHGELTEQPELRGRLLESMGIVYRSLGLYDLAEPLLKEAVDSSARAHGELHPEVATHLVRLAGLLIQQGRSEEARPHLERALSIQERVLDPGDPERARTLNNLGAAHRAAGRDAEALPYFEQALALRDATLDPDDPDLARSLINLGQSQLRLGRPDEALAAYERALSIRQRALGEDHPDTLNLLNSLAELHRNAGRYEAAREKLERLLPLQEKVLGPDHPALAYSLANLGMTEKGAGDLDAAARAFERSLAIGEEKLAPDHRLVLGVARQLAEVYRQLGREQRAAELDDRIARAG